MREVDVIGDLNRVMEVTDSMSWALFYSIEMYNDEYEPIVPGIELIERIIACQVGYYLLRRTSYICGSNCDHMWAVMRELKKQYLEATGNEYPDPNVDTDW